MVNADRGLEVGWQGEEEPTLTAYITTLIKQHKGPKDILEEVMLCCVCDSVSSVLCKCGLSWI